MTVQRERERERENENEREKDREGYGQSTASDVKTSEPILVFLFQYSLNP